MPTSIRLMPLMLCLSHASVFAMSTSEIVYAPAKEFSVSISYSLSNDQRARLLHGLNTELKMAEDQYRIAFVRSTPRPTKAEEEAHFAAMRNLSARIYKLEKEEHASPEFFLHVLRLKPEDIRTRVEILRDGDKVASYTASSLIPANHTENLQEELKKGRLFGQELGVAYQKKSVDITNNPQELESIFIPKTAHQARQEQYAELKKEVEKMKAQQARIQRMLNELTSSSGSAHPSEVADSTSKLDTLKLSTASSTMGRDTGNGASSR